jgi:hypothetical protein
VSEEVEGILGKLRPEPAREPLPPRRNYEPPSKGRYARRRGQVIRPIPHREPVSFNQVPISADPYILCLTGDLTQHIDLLRSVRSGRGEDG